MRFQTRAIAANVRGDGFVAASVEGRVAVEFIRDEENEKRRYAFKCHRKTDDASVGEIVYPVHAVAFHPVHGTFATGGGDGYVNFWDGDAKKRLFQSPRYPTSISALDFSPCGGLLAIASSYAHEERENNKPEDRLFLRETRAEEVTPKSARTS
jgi:cell cycle arrest protein BUB3